MLRAVLCFVALTVASVGSAQPPARDNPKPTGTAEISGRVLAGDGDQPLRRAVVTVASAAETRHDWNVLSDANGRFVVKGLPAGSFFVAATKQNYVRAVLGQQRPLGPGKPIDVAAGQRLANVDVRLQRTGVITGRIVDELDEPIAAAMVATLRYQMIPGGRRLMPTGRQVMTDDAGYYRLYGLQPGDYYVSASNRNNAMVGGNDDRTAYTPTYYPGTPVAGQAQKLTVAPGQTIPEINLTMYPTRASRVSGTAVDSQGQPLANARVMLTSPPGVNMGPMASAAIKADGSFSIGGVGPGDYLLRVSLPAGGSESAVVPVSVMGEDVTGVQVITAPPSIVRGRVVLPAGSAKMPTQVSARAVGDAPNFATSAVKPDGSFEIKIAAGRVQLNTQGLALRLRSVRAGGADVADTGLDIPANATIDDVVIELTDVVTQVNGSVVNASGEKTREAIVIFFSPNPEYWGFQSRYFSIVGPAPSLIYTARLTPGDYLVAALPGDTDRGRLTDPEFLSVLRDHAVPFTIAEGEKKTQDLTITEAPVQ